MSSEGRFGFLLDAGGQGRGRGGWMFFPRHTNLHQEGRWHKMSCRVVSKRKSVGDTKCLAVPTTSWYLHIFFETTSFSEWSRLCSRVAPGLFSVNTNGFIGFLHSLPGCSRVAPGLFPGRSNYWTIIRSLVAPGVVFFKKHWSYRVVFRFRSRDAPGLLPAMFCYFLLCLERVK